MTAFPIQSATIADALAGRDVLGKARTGSGKTLGFGLPLLTRLADLGRPAARKPLGIVLVPTRELAMQVGDALEPYAHALGLQQRLVAGGLSMSKQIQSLERGVHLVVATPGRLADLMRRGHADLSAVAVSVLDEADHMAEMGFAEEIADILATTPSDGQRLLFSATLDGVVDDLVSRFMTNPVLHDVTVGTDAPTQRHVVLAIPPHEKYRLATRIAAREGRTICFVRTKLGADRVAEEMRAAGVLAMALHGDRTQYERNQAMTEFRAGRLPVLVATDVAARGIHVDAVDVVLQIDPPSDFRDYTHRSGRTGRAGADGLAVTLTLPHQRKQMDRILDNAKVTAEHAQFRTVDAGVLAKIDALTGGREPSGIPVAEPVGPARFDRRGGRRDAGRRDAGRRDGGLREGSRREGGRYESGRFESSRFDGPRGDITRGDITRRDITRPDNTRPARPAPVVDAALLAREHALAQRERELAERERRLSEREESVRHAQDVMERDRTALSRGGRGGNTRSAQDRPVRQRDDWQREDRQQDQRQQDERKRDFRQRDERQRDDRRPERRNATEALTDPGADVAARKPRHRKGASPDAATPSTGKPTYQGRGTHKDGGSSKGVKAKGVKSKGTTAKGSRSAGSKSAGSKSAGFKSKTSKSSKGAPKRKGRG